MPTEFKFEDNQIYDFEWDITRNKQTITVDIAVNIDNGNVEIESCLWGLTEFTLDIDEEIDILNYVESNLEGSPTDEDEEDANV
jgi:hypothetical protein